MIWSHGTYTTILVMDNDVHHNRTQYHMTNILVLIPTCRVLTESCTMVCMMLAYLLTQHTIMYNIVNYSCYIPISNTTTSA